MLRVHFLNVGHGDCTIIKHHSGRLTMIDINNSQDYDSESYKDLVKEKTPPEYSGGILSGIIEAERAANDAIANELTDPIQFLQKTYPEETLFRFILTHPDLDHMRGLKRLYETIGFTNFWDTNNTKPAPESFRSEADKIEWNFYNQLRTEKIQGIAPKYYTRGDSLFAFGKNDDGQPGGDNIEILSPTVDLINACNKSKKSNSLSIVVRVQHAGKTVLLPGDAEKDAWEIMASYYGKILKSDFLKASHHGRDSAYHLDSVKLISPKIVFVSVGRKPDTDATSKYRQQSDKVASTRYHGNIRLDIHDDGQFEWFVDRNADQK